MKLCFRFLEPGQAQSCSVVDYCHRLPLLLTLFCNVLYHIAIFFLMGVQEKVLIMASPHKTGRFRRRIFGAGGASCVSCQIRKIAGCVCARNVGNVFPATSCLLRLCRSFCGCPQCGAAPYRDCFLDLRLFNSPDLRRLGLCYCCQAETLETVLGGNTALTRWWTARSIDADAKR